jgi:hypothetical protein
MESRRNVVSSEVGLMLWDVAEVPMVDHAAAQRRFGVELASQVNFNPALHGMSDAGQKKIA